jgi:hypothetical protein
LGKQDTLAAFLYQVKKSGIDIGQCCVLPAGVFFASHKVATTFAKKHDKKLVRVSGRVSGWLAKNRPAK